jgi:prevent-host-death family protein
LAGRYHHPWRAWNVSKGSKRVTAMISLAEDIKTAEDLEQFPRALLEQVQRTGRPITIAETGRPAVVMLTAERYEWLVHLVSLSRLLNEAEEDIRAGRVRPLEEFVRELENEEKLPRRNRRARRS